MDKRTFLKQGSLLAGGLWLAPWSSWATPARSPQRADAFTLPELGYAFDALEPQIDAQTMELHHGKHHAGYVAKLNAALTGSAYTGLSLRRVMNKLGPDDTAIRNNGGGHYNHSLFWKLLKPAGETAPSEALAAAIARDFGGMDPLWAQLRQAGLSRFGSGWAWLIADRSGKLAICSTPNQDNPQMYRVTDQPGYPLLGIDVWEHAYYLRYQNRRQEYLDAIWNLLNWQVISQQYETSQHPFILWEELDAYHDVMSATWHPAEEGDLAPLKARSGELVQAAQALGKSAVPATFDPKRLAPGLKQLRKDSAALHKAVQRGASDADLTTSLEALHGVFHGVMGQCMEE